MTRHDSVRIADTRRNPRTRCFGTSPQWDASERIARERHPELPSRAFDLCALSGIASELFSDSMVTPTLIVGFACCNIIALPSEFTTIDVAIARAIMDAIPAQPPLAEALS